MVQEVIQTKNATPSFSTKNPYMLQNMTRVIKNHRKTVIGVDCTLNIGEVYVKTTMYKKPCLVGKIIGDHPIFVGSLFSIQGSYEIYHQFFSHLSMKLSSLGPGIIFGTDGKIPLVSAIMKCFPNTHYAALHQISRRQCSRLCLPVFQCLVPACH